MNGDEGGRGSGLAVHDVDSAGSGGGGGGGGAPIPSGRRTLAASLFTIVLYTPSQRCGRGRGDGRDARGLIGAGLAMAPPQRPASPAAPAAALTMKS